MDKKASDKRRNMDVSLNNYFENGPAQKPITGQIVSTKKQALVVE
jgi:hypothetical protein